MRRFAYGLAGAALIWAACASYSSANYRPRALSLDSLPHAERLDGSDLVPVMPAGSDRLEYTTVRELRRATGAR